MKIKTWIVALMLVARNLHAAGGEIGNARYIDYSDLLNGFELRYPRAWSRMELGTSVSFVENMLSASAEETSVVNFSTERFEEIRTAEDLRRYLAFFRPEERWESLVIGNRPGFQALGERRGLAYLLREPGVVTVIRFRVGASEESRADVDVVVHSLKFQ